MAYVLSGFGQMFLEKSGAAEGGSEHHPLGPACQRALARCLDDGSTPAMFLSQRPPVQVAPAAARGLGGFAG